MNRTSTFLIPCSLSGLVAVLSLAILTGCETPAHRLDPKAVRSIEPGITTRQDILREYGRPRATTNANRQTLFFYERRYKSAPTYSPMPPGPATLIGLSLLFGEDDRVLRTHYSSHQVYCFWGGGSVLAGTPIPDSKMAQIRLNVTTRKEAVALLGEPCMEMLALGGGMELHWGHWQETYSGWQTAQIYRLLFNEADVVIASKKDIYNRRH